MLGWRWYLQMEIGKVIVQIPHTIESLKQVLMVLCRVYEWIGMIFSVGLDMGVEVVDHV